MPTLEGPIPALVTPFSRDNEINVKLLQELVEWLLAQRAGGFFVNGTSGEGFLMSLPERQMALETVVGQVRGRVPVVVNVSALATQDAVTLAKGAAAAGVDGVSAVPPFYYRVDDEAIKCHFAAIGSATSLPLYLYNIPVTTGLLITAAQFGQLLSAVPTLSGMKYSAHDLFNLRRIIELGEGHLNILSGYDEVFLPALSIGVDGAIGSTLNYMCLQYRRIYEAFRNSELALALEIQSKVNRVISAVVGLGTLAAVTKAPLSFLGFGIDDGRAPIRALTDEERVRLKADLETAGFFDLERR